VHFIITHPNGWNGSQPARIRAAACQAGIIGSESDDRLVLLTEGEASIHFCMRNDIGLKSHLSEVRIHVPCKFFESLMKRMC
jgi:hypothetical protein